MPVDISNNTKQQQFEVQVDGELAVLQYRFHEGVIWLMHTEVPAKLEGKGIASALARFGLEWARENHVKAKVLCPFVAIFLKRHPEYLDVVVP
jgi:predicted GNAT family acetyltransferase